MSRWKRVPPDELKRRRVFRAQKSNAKRRGIPFRLTYEQWWMVWSYSGKWSKRGRCMGQYCMARKGDRGAYTISNVSIVTVSDNGSEIKPYVRDTAWRKRQAKHMKGNTLGATVIWTKEKRARLSKALKGRVPGFGGKKHSPATIALKRARWRNQYSQGVGYNG